MLLKTFITFLCILVVSCIFNSIGIWMGVLPNYPPYPWGSRVAGVSDGGTQGVQREEQNYPEVDVTNGTKPEGFIYQVVDSKDRSQATYPYGANW